MMNKLSAARDSVTASLSAVVRKHGIMKLAIFLLVVLLATVWGSSAWNEHGAKEAVRKNLFDPDSAKFGSFSYKSNRACLEINAKNRMGGYVGQKVALLSKVQGEWLVIDIGELSFEELSFDSCKKIISNSSAEK